MITLELLQRIYVFLLAVADSPCSEPEAVEVAEELAELVVSEIEKMPNDEVELN